MARFNYIQKYILFSSHVLTILTHGSNRGSAAVITRGDPEDPETIHVIQRKGSDFTCSYEEELDAMQTTANWISLNCDSEISIMVCTDSQSLCQALLSYNVETATIRGTLHDRTGKTTIQWIPGHSDVPGNELADQAAKEATELETDPRPVSYRSACTMIRSRIEYPTNHQQLKKVYSHFSKQREQEVKTRADQVLLAQLRSGKHKVFRSYQHMIDESIDPTCTNCDSGEIHNLEHWFLRCPDASEARHEIFDERELEGGLGLLTKCPEKSIALAKRTLFGVQQ